MISKIQLRGRMNITQLKKKICLSVTIEKPKLVGYGIVIDEAD